METAPLLWRQLQYIVEEGNRGGNIQLQLYVCFFSNKNKNVITWHVVLRLRQSKVMKYKDVQYYAVQNYQGIRLITTKQSNDGNSPHHLSHIKPGAQKVMHLWA